MKPDGTPGPVVDTDEATLIAHAANPDDVKRQLHDLRSQLEGLWPPHKLTQSDKARIVSIVSRIVNYIPAQKVSPEEALEIYKALEPEMWRFYPGLITSDYWLVTAWVYAYKSAPAASRRPCLKWFGLFVVEWLRWAEVRLGSGTGTDDAIIVLGAGPKADEPAFC